MAYAAAVVERTMKVQEVMMQAISGKLTWLQAEEILGWRPRTLRRWRLRYQRVGYDGLWDRRRQQPSPRRAPVAEVARIARLYREHYAGFNAAHFHEIAQRDHGVSFGYTFVKRLLQTAGLLPTPPPRGPPPPPAPRGPALGAAASHAPASASCCTSTAALMPGSPCGPPSGRR